MTLYRERLMTARSCLVLFTVMLCLSFSIVQSEQSFAKDPEIKPEEVVAKHLKSIGQPEILATIKSRVVMGTASAEFFHGVIRTPDFDNVKETHKRWE
jgi:hypothetical protein